MKIYLVLSKIKDKVLLNGVFSTPADADNFINNAPKVCPVYDKNEINKQLQFMKQYKTNTEIQEKLKELKHEEYKIQYKILEYENYSSIVLGGSIDE